MTIGLPQAIYLVLTIIVLTVHGVKHGETKTTAYDFWSNAIASVLVIGLLWWGGFF